MRLIDADALKEKAWDADTRCGYVQVVDVGDIDDAPTIEERKTMQWEHCENDQDKWFVCPVCQWQTYEATNYCPNCGSKRECGK